MGQVVNAVSRHANKRHADSTMSEEQSTRCPVHSTALMHKSNAWESCWAHFHDAIVKGNLGTCQQLLTSERCATPMCLGSLSPAYRLRQLDSIAFSKLRTTALHMAALYRRPDLVQLLLEQGSEATVMDGFGRTPAAVLLEHWPRVTLPSRHSSPPWDQTPPSFPDRPAHLSDTLLQLLAPQEEVHPPEPDVPGREREMDAFREQVKVWRARSARCFRLLLGHGLSVNDVADRRRASTLLHIAARYDLVDVIELVLNPEKADVGRFRQSGSHPPAEPEPCGCCSVREEGDGGGGGPGQEDFSLRKGARKTSRPGVKGRVSLPLHMKRVVTRRMRSVVMKSHTCLAHWMWNQRRKNRLCQQGRPVRPADSGSRKKPKKSSSSLSVSDSPEPSVWVEGGRDRPGVGVEEKEEEEVGIPEVPADLEVVNATAKTPLAVAVDRGSLNAAHCLLSHGADVFTTDFYGRTILHFLSERDLTFDLLMQEVVRQGVDVQRADNGGNTALHVAAYMGNVSKVRFLLHVGAWPHVANLAGKTPLFLACQRRDPSARQILLLLLLSSVHVRVRDRLERVPPLLQREENAACLALLEHLHHTSDTLLRRCVVSVRRAIGFSRLLDMSSMVPLPCPLPVQQAVFGEEERTVVRMLHM